MTTAAVATPARSRSAALDATLVFLTALAVRLGVVGWAAARFPPAADGRFYHVVAQRIAQGLGYTWLWDDGVITYAAHYPVGYPAAVGALYAIAGAHPAAAMIMNALVGALAAAAAHALARRAASERAAIAAGLAVALHPGLVAYTPALMTEGVTGALVAIMAWLAARLRDAIDAPADGGWRGVAVHTAALGCIAGLATLVRPQSLLLAPVFAAIAAFGSRSPLRVRTTWVRAAVCGVAAGAVALAVCAPWTARNCVRMHRCALVSVNEGWNLLIGTDEAAHGTWSPIRVPDACRDVFDEAAKDACFHREARQVIADRPARWLALVPAKLAATFDYSGAAGWYLHESNPDAFDDRDKIVLGVIETAYERVALLLALALFWAGRDGRGRIVTSGLAVAGAIAAVTVHAWIGYVALVLVALAQPTKLVRGAPLGWTTAAAVAALAATHAVFFGAGRYALMIFPLVTALAGTSIDALTSGAASRRARRHSPISPAGQSTGD